MSKNRKKVLLFIVEGESDEVSFESLFDAFFENDDVHIFVTRGDITVSTEYEDTNVLNLLGKKVEYFCSIEKVLKRDIKTIIHLVDTDGAFISDSFIEQQERDKKTEYSESKIYAKNPEYIKKRNKIKADNLNKLCSKEKISGIPYYIYYLSRNLEHVLHNKIENLSNEEKAKLSNKFDVEYGENLEKFLQFINDASFSVAGDYLQTWEYIKQDANSLKRKSNLHLLFQLS